MPLNPLVAQNDANKPIISKILAVPALRARYLGFVREIAEKSLDWNALGPVVKQYPRADRRRRRARHAQALHDRRFLRGTADDGSPGTLRAFFEARRAFLLNWVAENAVTEKAAAAAAR